MLKVLLLLMIFISGTVFSQNITIKGKVLDAETNQPVEFANVGIVGSFMGTASDFNGGFELTISEEFSSYTVRISAVGYQSKEVKVADLVDKIGVDVKLIQQSYGIDQVEVMAESKRLYGILKTAANMISDNYTGTYSSNVYFVQTVNENQKSEIALNYTDAAGYGDRSFNNAYQYRDFKVREVRRNFEQKPIKKGMLRADDILEFDIVRVRGNVLDADLVDQFDLELIQKDSSPKDSVWVIKYSLSKPDFAATGDERVVSYKGVVYVSSVDYAILRNELEVVSEGYHQAGRASGIVSGNGEYSYKVKTSYRKAIDDKYALSKIEYSGSGSKTIDMVWVNYDYSSEIDTQINGRTYYSTRQTDDNYWNRFTLPKE